MDSWKHWKGTWVVGCAGLLLGCGSDPGPIGGASQLEPPTAQQVGQCFEPQSCPPGEVWQEESCSCVLQPVRLVPNVQCVQNTLCVVGHVWDGKLCACVPGNCLIVERCNPDLVWDSAECKCVRRVL